jgi:membrane-bound lytic murein transglycosylase B
MRFYISTLLFAFVLIFIFGQNYSHAQVLTPEQRARLEQELRNVEAEQKRVEADLQDARNQTASLSRDVTILNAKIKDAQLKIKAKSLLIQTLGQDITVKAVTINKLEDRINSGREAIAQLLRKTREVGSYSVPEMILSNNDLSQIAGEIDRFGSLNTKLKDTIDGIVEDENQTKEEKSNLEKKRNAEIDAKYEIEQEKKNIEGDEAEKKRLLAVSKNNEASYADLLNQKKAQAAKIRASLFSLRDSSPIPFGDAYKYALAASQKTGVRPAFLLAILTQESALGSNVGKCYLGNTGTGDGINAKTGQAVSNVMSPTRDVPAFVELLKQIGGDPYKTVVSCPLSYGFGGAMGPAQFIPSTWLLIKDRLMSYLGINSMPDPWNPAHAFMASSLYLSDLGASSQTYSAERNAACKYYSGKSCGLAKGNTSYGNQVMSKADLIQRTMINPITGI